MQTFNNYFYSYNYYLSSQAYLVWARYCGYHSKVWACLWRMKFILGGLSMNATFTFTHLQSRCPFDTRVCVNIPHVRAQPLIAALTRMFFLLISFAHKERSWIVLHTDFLNWYVLFFLYFVLIHRILFAHMIDCYCPHSPIGTYLLQLYTFISVHSYVMYLLPLYWK